MTVFITGKCTVLFVLIINLLVIYNNIQFMYDIIVKESFFKIGKLYILNIYVSKLYNIKEFIDYFGA